VNGRVLVENGQFSGALPGTLLRAGRDTDTVRPSGRPGSFGTPSIPPH
jgi:hypothetical protein